MELKTDITYLRLIAPFPRDAYSADMSRGSKNALTSVRAQCITERLNEVFGVYNWHFKEAFEVLDTGVLCKGVLTIISNEGKSRKVESVGYHESHKRKAVWLDGKKINGKFEMTPNLVGDVYKSASTDALGKGASKIGVANSVFKGLIPMQGYSVDLKALENDYRSYLMRLSAVPDLIAPKIITWSKTAPYEKLATAVDKYVGDLSGYVQCKPVDVRDNMDNDIQIDFPIPDSDSRLGSNYVSQNGKFRGERLKDIDEEELKEYLDLIISKLDSPNETNWHNEIALVYQDYLDNLEHYKQLASE